MSTATQQTDRPPFAVRHAVMGMRFFCRKRLTLPICPIPVEWAPEAEIGAKGDVQGLVDDAFGDSFTIRIATGLSPRKAAEIMAHELRHIEQFLTQCEWGDIATTQSEYRTREDDAKEWGKAALRAYEKEYGPLDTVA